MIRIIYMLADDIMGELMFELRRECDDTDVASNRISWVYFEINYNFYKFAVFYVFRNK